MEITLRPTQKQHEAYEALNDPEIDEVYLGGGAGGGKSWWLCESRLVNALRYPGYKSFIGREELKRLMQSTFVTWTKVCKFHNIPDGMWKLNGQYNYIDFANGSRIDLLDLKFLPTDPLFERFGSLEYTDGAIEEAGEVHYMALDVLRSRVGRHMNKEFNIRPTLAITFNPKKNWLYTRIYKPFKDGTLSRSIRFIQSLYTDNPHTAESYGEQLSRITDEANRKRLKDGEWEYDNDPSALIKYDNIVDLFTNTIEEKDERYLSADIARFGKDKTVIKLWKGLNCYKIIEYVKQSIPDTADKIKALERDENIPRSHVIIDEDGVGGGVLDLLPGAKGFIANTVPFMDENTEKPEQFSNLKAQCSYKLAEYINAHKIAISADITQIVKDFLIEELEQIKTKDADKEGKRKIIGKDEIKEVIGRSPDYSDAMMMRMYFEFERPVIFAQYMNKSKLNIKRDTNIW